MKTNSSDQNRGQTLVLSRRCAGRHPGVLICAALALSSLILSTHLGRGENLLVNGSFEFPGGIPHGSDILLTNGDTRLTGWTVGGAGGPIALHHGPSGPLIDFPPADGDYHLNFNAGDFSAGMWIAQALNTTVGQSYLASYQVAKIGATTSNVSLTVSALSQTGATLAQRIAYPPAHGYGPVQWLAFTATTPLTTLKILDTSTATIGVDIMLDNVSVVPLNCTPPPSGLVAWCPGDGNAVDVTSGGSGTVQNGASYAPGLVGQCFNFDGVNQWVSPPPGDLSNTRDNFTMEFWVYPTASRANTPETNSGFSGTSGQRYAIYPSPDPGEAAGVGVSVGNNGISVFEHGAFYLPSLLVYDGNLTGWTHVAVVYQNKQPTLYVNGLQVRTGQTGSRSFVYPSLRLGGFLMSPDYGHFAGLLDEISIYNRALSTAEIAAIYNAGSAGKCPPPPTFSAGLVAYYPFNGNVSDESGSGNNGVLHGTDWKYSFDRFGAANSLYLNTTSTPTVGLNGAYVAAPRSAGLDFNRDFTLSAWINLKSGIPPTPPFGFFPQNFISNGSDATNVNLRVLSDYGGLDALQFLWHTSGQIEDVVSWLAPVRDTWWQTTVVRSGSNVSLFKNGSFLASGVMTNTVANSPEIWFGRHITSTYPLIGGIDDVRMYNRALPPDEVLHLYYTENPQAPAITSQPQSRAAVAGSSLQFSVTAYGPGPLSYQWRKDGAVLPGFTDRICTLVGVFTNDVGEYSVTVSNAFGGTVSTNAFLAVRAVNPPPVIAGPITNSGNGHLYFLFDKSTWVEAEAAAVALGGHLATVRSQAEQDWIYATFANYGGTRRDVRIGLYDPDPLHNSTNLVNRRTEFAWVSGEPVAYTRWWTNEPNNTLDQGEFYGMIWGFAPGASSGYWNDIWDEHNEFNYGLAEVPLAPVIIPTLAAARTNVATSSVSFAANVSGLPPLTYQWWHGAQMLPSQTNRICTLVGVQLSDAGVYSLVVSNAFGVVTGAVTTLTVLPLTPPTVLTGPVINPANDHVYYLLNQSAWVEAEAAAMALGGHLATIRNQAEQDWVYSTFWNYGGVPRGLYIGLYDPNPIHNSTVRGERMAEFIWASGEANSYAHWVPLEPNNFGELGEFYVHTWGPPWSADWPGYWNDQIDATNHPLYGVVEVILPPTITLQPTKHLVIAGSDVLFAVSATGSKPLSYQWTLNGTNLPGATQRVLNLTNVGAQNGGTYIVLVSNTAASVPSAPAFLDVRYSLAYGNGGLMLGNNYTFIGPVDLQFWSVFPNANIFYTLDGSEPSFMSSYYGGPFSLPRSATLRVIAYSADFFQAAEAPPIYLTVIPIYPLNLLSPGGGNVTATPPTSPYASNTVVTLTAQPSNGWTFLEWRGDASGTSPSVHVAMQRAKTVQAIFGTTLGTTVAGSGAVVVHPALPLYPYGTVAQLTAIPQAGSHFAVWGNAASGDTNPLYFAVVRTNPVISSLFTSLTAGQYALTLISDGFGQVSATPQGNVFAAGTGVSLAANPDPGQQFLGWSGDATGTQNPLPVSMTASKTIIATFTRKPSLTVDPPLNGMFDGRFRLTLNGEFGQTYRIDASTNLVNWLPRGTLTNVYGTTLFTDESPTDAPRRFYRALGE